MDTSSRGRDPFRLERFVTAQAVVFDTAMNELRAGRKHTHWMWFIFPQLKGLGRSHTATFYGIESAQEGLAYLEDPCLGPRLLQATEAALHAQASSLNTLFGSPDDMKFRSSMTLFDAVHPDGVFEAALERWCSGERDPQTLALLASRP